VAERFIELSVIMYYRPLTTVELKEFFESYHGLATRDMRHDRKTGGDVSMRAVPRDAPHTSTVRGNAAVVKKFPKDVEDFIHELIANAIIRAEKNGIEIPKEVVNEEGDKSAVMAPETADEDGEEGVGGVQHHNTTR